MRHARTAARKFCPGCTEEIELAEDLCEHCVTQLKRISRQAPKRQPRTGRLCNKCGRKLGPERMFNCRTCVKPDATSDLTVEWFDVAAGGFGRKTPRSSTY